MFLLIKQKSPQKTELPVEQTPHQQVKTTVKESRHVKSAILEELNELFDKNKKRQKKS